MGTPGAFCLLWLFRKDFFHLTFWKKKVDFFFLNEQYSPRTFKSHLKWFIFSERT